MDSHALVSCRSPSGRACRPTRVPWQPSVRRQTTISEPASTPCRCAGRKLAVVGWDRGQLPLNPHTLCPVPARARPAGAERSGCADHTSRPQGPAQGALLCVAGGLPAAPGPEVDGAGRRSGWARLSQDIRGAPSPGHKPCMCSRNIKAARALLSRLCLSLPHCCLLGAALSQEGCLKSGGCCPQE